MFENNKILFICVVLWLLCGEALGSGGNKQDEAGVEFDEAKDVIWWKRGP